MLFLSSRWFEDRKHDSRLAKLCNFHLQGLFEIRDWNMSLLNSFTLALKTSFQALKRRRDRFKPAIFYWWLEHVFTLNTLLERLKRYFDDFKIVSFQFTGKL